MRSHGLNSMTTAYTVVLECLHAADNNDLKSVLIIKYKYAKIRFISRSRSKAIRISFTKIKLFNFMSKAAQSMIIYRMVIVEGRCDKLQLLISYI